MKVIKKSLYSTMHSVEKSAASRTRQEMGEGKRS
jgi:hypothetical protein